MPATALAPLHTFSAHEHPVNRVAFGAGGRLMATGDTEMVLKLWRNRELVRSYDLRSDDDKIRPIQRLHGVCFSPDGERLYVAAGETVSCFDASGSAEPSWVYTAPRLLSFLVIAPASLDVSRRGKVAASFDNGTIAFWNPQGERTALIRHNAAPRRIAFLSDETLLGADAFSVSRWSEDQRKPLSVSSVKDRIYGMAVSSTGRYLALRHLWHTAIQRLDTGEIVAQHRHGRGLPLLAFASEGEVLAVGSQHAIRLYDASSGAHAQLSLEDAELISLTLLPGGGQVVAGCSDGTVRTWENPLAANPASGQG